MYQNPSVLRGSEARHTEYMGANAPGGGRDRLREPEVRVREERERELVVLADGDERPRRVQALHTAISDCAAEGGGRAAYVGEEEEREEVDEGVRQLPVLLERVPDLQKVPMR